LRLRLNGDSGTNYAYSLIGFAGTAVANEIGNAFAQIKISAMGNTAGNFFGGMVSIIGGKTAGYKSLAIAGYGDGPTSVQSYSGLGYYNASAAITSISIISSTGNFDNGTVYIYGG
jgi:hypothetical protein